MRIIQTTCRSKHMLAIIGRYYFKSSLQASFSEEKGAYVIARNDNSFDVVGEYLRRSSDFGHWSRSKLP